MFFRGLGRGGHWCVVSTKMMIGVLLAFHLPVGGSVRIPDFTHVQHELVLAEVETLGRGKTRAPEISARAAYAGGLLTGHHGEVCFRGEARRFFFPVGTKLFFLVMFLT